MTAPEPSARCARCGRQAASMTHMLPYPVTYGWWTSYDGIAVHAFVPPKEEP